MLRRLVLDILKPHNPSILNLSNKLSNVKGIDGVNIITIEIDKKVETVKIILQDPEINFNRIKKTIEESGDAIHSVCEVAAGKKIIEDVETPQDQNLTHLR